MSETWTVRRAILWTADFLQKKGADAPRTDADLLLAQALGVDRVRLLIDFDKPLSKEELASFRAGIQRRAAGEPLAYILGKKEFYGREFEVDQRVLIPRPETEALVEFALEHLPEGSEGRVLDLCAGSGCVGISIAKEREGVAVDLVELDPGAAEVAQANVEGHEVEGRVRVLTGDLFAPVEGPYDVVVSNPPYVPSSDLAGLSQEVKREPSLALDGGADGLDVARRIVSGALPHLSEGGMLALELDIPQPPLLAPLASEAGFAKVEVREDFTRRDRYLVAWRQAIS